MPIARCVVLIASLTVLGCADGGSIAGPGSPEAASLDRRGSSAARIETSGTFEALVDFSTLSLTPRGANCLLEVAGQLNFAGTIEGAAPGRTTALVFATCDDVVANPPGTFPDVFRSELVFEGTVGGVPARARVFYLGRVQPGGAIDARLVFVGDTRGVLEADARVAVGGTYAGSLVVTSASSAGLR